MYVLFCRLFSILIMVVEWLFSRRLRYDWYCGGVVAFCGMTYLEMIGYRNVFYMLFVVVSVGSETLVLLMLA